MPTFCKPIVFVQVNHPEGKTSRPHVRLCLPDTSTFEEAFTAALAVEDGSASAPGSLHEIGAPRGDLEPDAPIAAALVELRNDDCSDDEDYSVHAVVGVRLTDRGADVEQFLWYQKENGEPYPLDQCEWRIGGVIDLDAAHILDQRVGVEYPRHTRAGAWPSGQATKQSGECSGQYYVKYDEARHKDEWINFVSLGGPVQSWKREGSAEWVGAGGAGEPAGEGEVLVEARVRVRTKMKGWGRVAKRRKTLKKVTMGTHKSWTSSQTMNNVMHMHNNNLIFHDST